MSVLLAVPGVRVGHGRFGGRFAWQGVVVDYLGGGCFAHSVTRAMRMGRFGS
jgi:hypothetical protein